LAGRSCSGVEPAPDGSQGHEHLAPARPRLAAPAHTRTAGNTVNLTVNGTRTSYGIPSSFNPYRQYFKAGSYNQSSSDSTGNGAKVKFSSLRVTHG
jgi:hypothetical protein